MSRFETSAWEASIAVFGPTGAAALVQALVGHDVHALFAMAIALGLRAAEALGLRWPVWISSANTRR